MNRLRATARWLAAIRTATGGIRRHKLQAIVIGTVLLISTASATLGFALLAASNAPFQHAFSAQRGAHVAVTVNTAHASPAELAATATLHGVTATAGPFGAATVPTKWGGQPFGQLTLAGRAAPGGPVDDVVLSAGHWPDGPGQLVLDGPATSGQGGPRLGNTVTIPGLRGSPALTIVGFANSVTSTADGWVTPGEISHLRALGAPASAQMLYRFASAGSYTQIRADVTDRLSARLRLPRPAGLGLAAPFARPGRTAVSLAAIAFGATAVIFAFGLNSSLSRAAQSQTHSATVPVQMQESQNGPQSPSAAQDAAMTAVLRAQPGTAHYVALYGNQVKVAGIAGNVFAQAYAGNAAWIDYGLISGRWYSGPGEVDVNTAFLSQSGLGVGDTVTVNTGTSTGASTGASQVTARIAGEVFDPSGGDARLYGSAQTLPGVATAANLQQYDVGLRPGTSATGYIQKVNRALGANSAWQATPPDGGQFYSIAIGLVGLLALMVAAAAGLGVLNTVLMTTRDRVHDLGIFKALGMRPGQMLTMVVCWIAGPAVLAAVIAAPAAVALNTATIRAMAGTAHTGVPASFTQVFPPSRLALLSLAAIAIAVAGALLPASWAARTRPAVALRTE